MRPSAPIAISLLALMVALSTTSWAQNGAAFVLGAVNSATARTYLGANFNGPALQVANTSTAAAATALSLSVAANHAPLQVNSTTRVTNLNADYLDGVDITQVARVHRIPYNLAPGANSPPIAVPANLPVSLVGISVQHPIEGVSHLAVVNFSGQALEWTGTEPPPGAYDAGGYDATQGTHMVYLDWYRHVELQVNTGATMRVHNDDTIAHSGTITLIW